MTVAAQLGRHEMGICVEVSARQYMRRIFGRILREIQLCFAFGNLNPIVIALDGFLEDFRQRQAAGLIASVSEEAPRYYTATAARLVAV